MRPTRTAQPYRVGPRSPGAALTAMTRGRTAGGVNSMDLVRAGQRMQRLLGGRPKRPARPARPQRPPR